MRINPDIEVLDVDGEVVTFDGDRLNLLDGAAAEAFRLVDGTRTELDVATVLAERYGMPVDALIRDVGVLLADFAGRGLLAG
jgi:hypothetical protein